MTSLQNAGNLPRMNNELVTRLLQRLEVLGISENEACIRAGIGRDTIRDLRRGRRSSLTVKVLQKLAIALDTSVSWLLTGEDDALRPAASEWLADTPTHESAPAAIGSIMGATGIPDGTIAQVDVTAGLGGGGITTILDGVQQVNGLTFSADAVSDYWRLPDQALARVGARPKNIAAVPCQGDSMSPTIADGDVVFIDLRHRVPSPPGVYALADEFGGIIIKRLEVIDTIDDDALVRVSSDNPRHSTRERRLSEIQIVGRYIGKFSFG